MSLHWMNHVLKHSRAESGARFVLTVLAHHADETGLSWPSVTLLGLETDLSPRSVQRHLRALENAKELLTTTRQGRISAYRIITPQRATPDTSVAPTPDTSVATPDTSVTPPLTPVSPGTAKELPLNCQSEPPAGGGRFAELPSEGEMAEFCRTWAGDHSRGIPPVIPEAWWLGKLAFWLAREKKPGPGWNWRAELVTSFKRDWVNRRPETRGPLPPQKNGAPARVHAFEHEQTTGRTASPVL